MAPRTKRPAVSRVAEPYQHTQQTPMRPEVGTQAQFRKRKAPKTYRYDSSLDPALSWDDGASRAMGEWLLSLIVEASKLPSPHRFAEPKQFLGAGNAVLLDVGGLADAVKALENLGKPFLDWAGKAERLSMEVPTLPLFIHERLSTQAILATLKGHKREGVDQNLSLFGDPQRPLVERMRPYEHRDKWVNRMVLGDSLVVMNSLLEYEGMGGQVQMVYMDPPYGVSFGSNFQPFVRKRSVENNDDADLTREPEMVQAYRDTWELGLHSYLTYLRDRLMVARDLLTPNGSVFVQISDENLHHVREVMSEVFGAENFCVTFLVKKKGGQKSGGVDPINDYLLWFAKDRVRALETFTPLFHKIEDDDLLGMFGLVELADGTEVSVADLSKKDRTDYSAAPKRLFDTYPGLKLFASENLTSGGRRRTQSVPYVFRGRTFDPGIAKGNCWKHSAITDDGSPSGLDRLASAGRLFVGDKQLRFKRYASDFGFTALTNWWDTTAGASKPVYVVQTSPEVVKRCLLMVTKPGDIVLDPTCGSGTTAYVAEQWGRRWITCDTSRVPLALARQRMLTALFPWYKVQDGSESPSAGFVYTRSSRGGRENGGVIPHITSSTIANDELAGEEVLVDRPDEDKNVTRITGPFVFEATIPVPLDVDGAGKPETERAAEESPSEQAGSYADRMLDILRRSPLLRLEGNRTVQLHNIRPLTRTLAGLLEATVDATAEGQTPTLTDAVDEAAERNGSLLTGITRKPVAIVFGPENGSISEGLVYGAAKEAAAKDYTHLYCMGFAIEPNARQFIQSCDEVMGVPATYVQATMDLNMGDLLKNMRSSQIFSVCGLPDVAVTKQTDGRYQVELKGLDVFDPITMENHHAKGDDVPAWLLDTDYNGMCFHVTQAFFPRTSAWDALKKALKADYEASLWDHLAGAVSAPFEASATGQIAVKVIDDRGNELMVVKALSEATAVKQ